MKVCIKNKSLPMRVEEIREDSDVINANKALFKAYVESLSTDELTSLLVDRVCTEFRLKYPHIK